MIINIPFDSTDETMELIKICTLYFDKTNIICPMFDCEQPYFDERKIDDLSVLYNQGLIDIDYEYFLGPNQNSWDFITENADLCFVNFGDVEDGIFDLMQLSGVKEYLANSTPEDEDIIIKWTMEATNNVIFIRHFQVAMAYDMLLNKKNVASNYYGIQELYKKICDNSKTAIKSSIALNTIPIFIPQYKHLNYEDIYEIKIKAEPELLKLQAYIENLSDEYNNSQFDINSIQSYVKRIVNPAINDFERKLKSTKLNVFSKLIKEIKNPLSYSPLLTTFFANIPPSVLLTLSLGLIGAEVALDYVIKNQEIKMDPLFFSLKLKSFE